MKQAIKNCAIYCRKSSDEGLDMDFNTLDAQREACEAYIMSQKSEGWKAIGRRYDDGGFSGGTLGRPALQDLLADIRERKVDIVVVYKIDRLTRSLMDFAKLVEIFDEFVVTFVSVTQSFNTTTSMGRLTLNVLLSFAQFEREVSAERIRDKIAASKKKGMWMGGNLPVGYDVADRKLIVDREGAKRALHIFERYLALGCVTRLKREFDAEGIVSIERVSRNGKKVGGKPYSRGALYSILQNPVYIGKIRHKDQIYDGQHEAIIPQDTWDAVQDRLVRQAGAKRGHRKASDPNMLRGRLFDCEGTPYSPVYTRKKNAIAYRYYISQNLIQYRDHPKGTMARIPAQEIEQAVVDATAAELIPALALDPDDDYRIIEHVSAHAPPAGMLAREVVSKVTVSQDALEIELSIPDIRSFLERQLDLVLPVRSATQSYKFTLPFTIRRAWRGAVILKTDHDSGAFPDLPPVPLKNLIRGIVWRDEHFAGTALKDIAAREGLSKAAVQKIVMGSFDTLMNL